MLRDIKATLHSLQPSPNSLRVFGVLLGALIVFASRTIEGADALGGSAAGIFIAVFAALLPGAVEPVWKTLMALTLPIGWLVSRAILVAFFYLVLAPVSLVLRMAGHDPMNRRLSKDGSYWEPFEENKRPDSMGL